MEKGTIQIYHGMGQGKTSAALGQALRKACDGDTAIIIQFMKSQVDTEYLKKLEPEIKIFRFERTEEAFEDLNDEQKQEQKINIQNGLNYAKKVLATGECNLLILDEVLGIIDEGMATEQDVIDVLDNKSIPTNVILTGYNITPGLFNLADSVLNVMPEK